MSEEVILVSDSGKLKLTNQRVVLDDADHYAVIPLDMVASCEIHTTHRPWIIVLAGLVALAGAAMTNRAPFGFQVGVFGVALFIFLMYFALRSGTIEVRSSGGGAIVTPTAGMSHEQAKRFADVLSEQIERRS